ncbi:DoxX family protein [Streptomyces viridiviolaceus]
MILPAVLDIAPVLVPLVATGLALLFTGAITVRLRRGERATIAGDGIFLVLVVFVAWGRFAPSPSPADPGAGPRTDEAPVPVGRDFDTSPAAREPRASRSGLRRPIGGHDESAHCFVIRAQVPTPPVEGFQLQV